MYRNAERYPEAGAGLGLLDGLADPSYPEGHRCLRLSVDVTGLPQPLTSAGRWYRYTGSRWALTDIPSRLRSLSVTDWVYTAKVGESA